MDEKWKLDMLKHLWSGEEKDTGKDKQQHSGKKGSKSPGSKPWPSVDLHSYTDLHEQLTTAEAAIDRALRDGYAGLVIIHGKGSGLLRQQVAKMLRKHPRVANYKKVMDSKGESGAFRVRLG